MQLSLFHEFSQFLQRLFIKSASELTRENGHKIFDLVPLRKKKTLLFCGAN